MDLTKHGRRVAIAMAFVGAVAACGSDPVPLPDPEVGIGSSTVAVTITPAATPQATEPAEVTTQPSPTLSSATASTASTASFTSSTSTPAIAPTSVPSVVCDQSDGVITTASGRRVLLRAAGLGVTSPTVLVLHGYTGTPTGIERVAELTEVANAAGIAVAYPEGMATTQGGFGWNSGAAVFATIGVDDVAALIEMIDAIVATGCVDRDRITLTGESNGAGMTLAAICAPQLREAFRSAVMVIPAIDDGVLARCEAPNPPVPLTAVAGRLDRTAPFDGGNGLLAQQGWFDRVATSVQNCRSVASPVALSDNLDRSVGDGCGACTELLAVGDGPHTWPGTSVGSGGLSPGRLDLNRRIVADVLAPQPGCLSSR